MLDELRTGDMIAFKKSRNIFSKLVHVFTHSNVNHVALVVKLYNRNGKGFPFIIEANENDGVEYHYLPTKLAKTESELYVYKLTDENLDKIDRKINKFYQYANEQIGKAYSVPDAIETVLDKLFDKTITKDDFEEFICSILVGALYQYVGVITPAMLKESGFQCVSELTPVDCCKLPIFKAEIKLDKNILKGEQLCQQV
jgi:hypothetical protein